MNLPKKSLGQNYLIDKNVINKIIKQVKIKNKNVLEIGPGTANLTDEIIKEKRSLYFSSISGTYNPNIPDIFWNGNNIPYNPPIVKIDKYNHSIKLQ